MLTGSCCVCLCACWYWADIVGEDALGLLSVVLHEALDVGWESLVPVYH